MGIKFNIKVLPDSEAEVFFVEKCCPKCKNGVSVRLGSMWGTRYNTYVIGLMDRIRIRKEMKILAGK